jgi:hypothetical protein
MQKIQILYSRRGEEERSPQRPISGQGSSEQERAQGNALREQGVTTEETVYRGELRQQIEEQQKRISLALEERHAADLLLDQLLRWACDRIFDESLQGQRVGDSVALRRLFFRRGDLDFLSHPPTSKIEEVRYLFRGLAEHGSFLRCRKEVFPELSLRAIGLLEAERKVGQEENRLEQLRQQRRLEKIAG